MGKTKSAICLTLITLVIAVLCIVCFVSFPCGEIQYYNSLLSLADKDADLGGYLIGETAYVGGGYFVVYYPEGVISSREYEETSRDLTGDELDEYQDKYVSYANGAVYLEKEVVCEEGTSEVSETFNEDFNRIVELMKERYESLHVEGTRLQIRDDYTIRAFLPSTMDASVSAFRQFTYTGEFSVRAGSDEDSAEIVFPSQKGTKRTADYYVKSVSARSSGGTDYLIFNMTDEGRQAIADATADATGYLYFYVGDNVVVSLTISEQIDQNSLAISGGFTSETSAIIAALIDTAIKSGESDDLALNMSEISFEKAGFGENALTLLYIAIGAISVAMIVFFLIRYRRLAFAHIYSYLVFLIAMTLCIWAGSALYIGVGTVAAVAITAFVLCLSNAISYEYARKEYEGGKTMTFSIKTGYRKCMWHIFDIHIVLAVLGLLIYLIALTELSIFGAVLALGAVFSGICSLLLNRFFWYIMMPFAKNQSKFCHFKRTEVDDDE